MALQPKQEVAIATLLDPQCKYLLYGGAVGGGKSYLLRWAAVAYLIYIYGKYGVKNVPVGLFSENYPTLKDRQISRIKREFPEWLGTLRDSRDEGYAFYLHERYGAGRILLRNLDDPSKYLSSEFAAQFVEELTRNDEATFQDLRNRLRYPSIPEVKFMGATNPGGIGHGWVKKFFITPDRSHPDREQDRVFYVHASAYDNSYIDPTYIEQLEALPERKRKAYLEGSWDIFAGQVFSEFSDRHVVEPFIPNKDRFKMIVGGMDWGRAAPSAIYITGIQEVPNMGKPFHRAFTFLELYGAEQSPKYWATLLKDRLAEYGLSLADVHFIQADTNMFNLGNDMSKSIVDQMADVDNRFLGLMQKAAKDRLAGWEAVHNWLSDAPDGLPYWLISRACPNLIRTLPEQVYDENKIEDVDSSGEDHACFCRHTKVLTRRGYVPIIDVIEGDYTWTPQGWQKILKLHKTGKRQVIPFRGMKVTQDHRFLTHHGFLPLRDLRETDRLWSVSTFKASPTADIQIRQDYPIESISAVVRRKLEAANPHSIKPYGFTIMGLFLMVSKYITKATITTTTLFQILRWSLLPSMFSATEKRERKQEEKTSKLLARLRPYGMGLMRVINFTKSSEKSLGRNAKKKSSYAKPVVREAGRGSALKQNTAASIAKCRCSGFVETYSLTTTTGAFTAGGVIVSNSDAVRYMFRRVQWLDGKVGAVSRSDQKPKMPSMVPKTSGKVRSLNTDLFAKSKSGRSRGVGVK